MRTPVLLFLCLLPTLISCGKSQEATELPRNQALYVTMRDGVRIAIDVWLPENQENRAPVPTLMRMTRYWRAQNIVAAEDDLTKDSNYQNAARLNEAGYAYVIVDARGTGASFGNRQYETTQDEVEDYGEVAAWIASQPWSNGNVGSFGVSYDGTTAEMLAVNGNPAVKAVAPLYPDWNAFDHLIYPGNVFLNFFTDDWGHAVGRMDANDVCGLQGVPGDQCPQLLAAVRGVKPVDEDRDGSLLVAAVRDHQSNIDVAGAARSLEYRDDSFGTGPAFVDRLSAPAHHARQIEESGVAVFSRVGWLDAATVNGALSRFNTLANPQTVVIGALSHGGGKDTDPFRNTDAQPVPSSEEQLANMLAWFEPHLAGSPPPAEKTIRYSTLGSDQWLETSVWPPAGLEEISWYFGPGNSLTTESGAAGTSTYTVDRTATTGGRTRWHTNMGGGDVLYGDRRNEDNKLLLYTSAPLASDTWITGHPVVTLQVASSATDGAFFVYLESVAPDGNVRYVTEGQLRASSRAESEQPPPYWHPAKYRTFTRDDATPLVPGETTELTFDLWATSVLFKKGDRIRIALAGADAGNFLDIPAQGTAPTWTVHHGGSNGSRIVLPTRPAEP